MTPFLSWPIEKSMEEAVSLHVVAEDGAELLIRDSATPFDRQYAENVVDAYAQGWRPGYQAPRAEVGGVARIEARRVCAADGA